VKFACYCNEVILSASYLIDSHDCENAMPCEECVCLLWFLIDYHDCNNVLAIGSCYLTDCR